MQVAESIIMYRAGLSFALVIGGVLAIYLGFLLFSRGSGLKRGLTKLQLKGELGSVSMAGISVGAVLMISSCVWGIAAWQSFPTMTAGADGSIQIVQDAPVSGAGSIEDFAGVKVVQTDIIGKPYDLPPIGVPVNVAEVKEIADQWEAAAADAKDKSKILVLWGDKGSNANLATGKAFKDALEQAGTNVAEVRVINSKEWEKILGEYSADAKSGALLMAVTPPTGVGG